MASVPYSEHLWYTVGLLWSHLPFLPDGEAMQALLSLKTCEEKFPENIPKHPIGGQTTAIKSGLAPAYRMVKKIL
jgi:hypothetical protein